MNKKDCDDIAYNLVYNSFSIDELYKSMFKLDPRIEEYFNQYLELQGYNKEVDELTKSKMIEKYGNDWVLYKGHKEYYKIALKESRKEIYGDEYDFYFKD